MKAIVLTRFGPLDVLQLKEVEKPAPQDNTCPTCWASAGEVLIRVHATTVFAADCKLRGAKVPLAFKLPPIFDHLNKATETLKPTSQCRTIPANRHKMGDPSSVL
jgi:NADPH:quinone reductase-like Zn-dependent oxidoreductase